MSIGKRGLCYKIASVLLIIIGVLMPFFLMRYSINFADEPYQIMNAMDYLQSPSTIFSAYIYNILGSCFGFELLKMRIIMAVISITTIIIPMIYFYWKRRNVWETMFVGGLALLLLSAVQQKSTLVGWDILSNFFLSASTMITLIYIESKNKIALLTLLGVFVMMATLSRIPNIIIVLIVLFAIFIDKKYTRKIRDAIIFISSFCVSILVVILWIYGDVSLYISAWNEWGFTNNHNILKLLEIYVNDGVSLVCVIGLVALVYISIYVVTQYPTIKQTIKYLPELKYIVATIWLIFFLKLLYRYEYMNVLTNGLYNAIFLLMLMYIWIKNRINLGKSIVNKTLLIILLCSFVSAAGSDTGCFKIANISSLLYLLPMFLPIASNTAKNTIVVVIVSILIYFPCNKARQLFFDEGLAQATVELNLPYITGIHTTQANNEILNEVYNTEKCSSTQDVLFVGFGRQLFEYMLDCRANYARHNFLGELDDEKYILETKAYLAQNSSIKRVYVVNTICMYGTLMDTMLEENGYELCKTASCYRAYKKVILK